MLRNDIKDILITEEQLKCRIKKLGEQITKDYLGKDVVLIGVLKGAMLFLSDLMRQIDLPLAVDTICVSSYGEGTVSSGNVKIRKDIDNNVEGKHVIIVEDIIDTGITMDALADLFRKRGALSVEIAVCLDKKERREKEVYTKYVGFEVPDEFIVGYGCDYAEKYRNLPYVGTLQTEIFKNS